MKILIVTVGTRGDVQPYVALGKGLAAAGHEVVLCTSQTFEPFIRKHGLGYALMNDGLLEFMRTDLGKAAMENATNFWESVKTALKILPTVAPIQRRHLRERWQAIDAIRPDLVVFHPKAGGTPDMAAHVKARCMLGFYLPIFVPTGEFPATGIPDFGLGRWYNRLSYRLISKAMWRAAAKFINEWRAQQGMRPRREGKFLQTPDGQVIPAMHAYSEAVIPMPNDWPATATVTGYWFLDESDGWEPPAQLERFLAGGEPPVYVGFGSIFGRDPLRLTRMVLEAVQQAGVRAILAGGWGGLEPTRFELPDTVHAIETAPHDWLFPRVSAVVHHGGCGTTAAGLRAGRPTVICPFFGDQPFWGTRVHALGVGPKAIPQKRLTVQKLASAIRQAVTDPSLREAAAELGRRIRAEDGVGNAVAFIERHARQP